MRGPVDGTVRPPGSKSYTNRALVLAALAEGRSAIDGALFSDDTRHMANGIASLGVRVVVRRGGERFEVDGCAGKPTAAEHASVFVGNSGTTARFLAPVLALGSGSYDLYGDEAMAKRPIAPLLDALVSLGVEADERPRQRLPARAHRVVRPRGRRASAWPAASAASTSAPC